VKKQQHAGADEDHRIGKDALGKDGLAQGTAIEQVEDLREGDHGHAGCLRLGQGERVDGCRDRQVPDHAEIVPEKQTAAAGGHDRGDNDEPIEDEPGKYRLVRRPRLALHGVRFEGLESQGHRESDAGHQVDPQDLDRRHGHEQDASAVDRDRGKKEHGHSQNGGQGQIGGQDEGQGLDQVVVDSAPLLHGCGDGGEVVVHEHHLGRLLGNRGAGDAHGHADVGPFQGRSVVDAVAGHGDHVTHGLEHLHQAELVFGSDPGKDVGVYIP